MRARSLITFRCFRAYKSSLRRAMRNALTEAGVSVTFEGEGGGVLKRDLVHGYTYRPPGGFFQVNRSQNAQMVRWLLELLADREVRRFADLSEPAISPFPWRCGQALGVAGTLQVCPHRRELAACEQDSLSNSRKDSNSMTVLREEPFDAVIVDPARAGAPRVAAELAPGLHPFVFWVACDPVSFARIYVSWSIGSVTSVVSGSSISFRKRTTLSRWRCWKRLEGGREAD